MKNNFNKRLLKYESKKGIYSGLSWLFWWDINSQELERQVEQYNTLKIFQSARGISFLICILIALYGFVSVSVDFSPKSLLFDAFLFLIMGLFIYNGYRWAIIVAMCFWTFFKFSHIIFIALGIETSNSGLIIWHIVFWSIYMHTFYFALKVENIRRKEIKKVTITSDKG